MKVVGGLHGAADETPFFSFSLFATCAMMTWWRNSWARLAKRHRYKRKSVRTIMVASACTIAVILIVMLGYPAHTSVVPTFKNEGWLLPSGIQDLIQNVTTYLNESAMDYGKGQLAIWGYYIPEDGLFFCPVPKVACAEWKRTMRWIGGLGDWETIEHDPLYQGNIPIFAFTDESTGLLEYSNDTIGALKQGYNFTDIVSDPGTVKMMVVRNPINRLVSGFINKCIDIRTREYDQCPYLRAFPSIWNGNPPSERTAETDEKYQAALQGNGCFYLGIEGACTDIFAEFVNYLDRAMNTKLSCSYYSFFAYRIVSYRLILFLSLLHCMNTGPLFAQCPFSATNLFL